MIVEPRRTWKIVYVERHAAPPASAMVTPAGLELFGDQHERRSSVALGEHVALLVDDDAGLGRGSASGSDGEHERAQNQANQVAAHLSILRAVMSPAGGECCNTEKAAAHCAAKNTPVGHPSGASKAV
jgi:hypothetical protein